MKGETGDKGPKGDRGLRGITGHDGDDGWNGRDGRDGVNGKRGLRGKDGVTGPTGATGPISASSAHRDPGYNGKLVVKGKKDRVGHMGYKGDTDFDVSSHQRREYDRNQRYPEQLYPSRNQRV